MGPMVALGGGADHATFSCQVGVLIGRDHISGSPFAVVIKPADAKPLDSALGGAGLTLATAGEVTSSSFF